MSTEKGTFAVKVRVPGARWARSGPAGSADGPGADAPCSCLLRQAGMAQMLKGGVIMDVINVEQARIAEEAGALRPAC